MPLDETPLRYNPSVTGTHVPAGVSQVFVRGLSDHRRATATPVVTRHGLVPMFQVLQRGKTKRCHTRLTLEAQAALPKGLFQDHCPKKCQMRESFMCLIRRVYAYVLNVRRSPNQVKAPAILILDRVPSYTIGLDEMFGQKHGPHLFWWLMLPCVRWRGCFSTLEFR